MMLISKVALSFLALPTTRYITIPNIGIIFIFAQLFLCIWKWQLWATYILSYHSKSHFGACICCLFSHQRNLFLMNLQLNFGRTSRYYFELLIVKINAKINLSPPMLFVFLFFVWFTSCLQKTFSKTCWNASFILPTNLFRAYSSSLVLNEPLQCTNVPVFNLINLPLYLSFWHASHL